MAYRPLSTLEKLNRKVFDKRSMISDELLESKIRGFSKPTLSYFMLLIASVIIATLGLLMNASAIVIGSMIISPLTWPMFGLADGAALGNRKRIWANLAILGISILLGVMLAYVLTILSPLKVINSEILARSQPTLLDAVVALTAGGIGTLAIVRKNISDSVAGVAVALSLTPPLCVLGIALALGEGEIVIGSLLLLATNALSITFIAGVLFILIHYSWRRKLRMAPKAFGIMAGSLLITAIPLYQLLNDYSLETSSYSVVQQKLDSFVQGLDPNSSIQNVQTSLEEQSGTDTLVVTADAFIPDGNVISFTQKENLVSELEQDLDRRVDLQLRIQNISLLASESDIADENTSRQIQSAVVHEVLNISPELKVDQITPRKDNDQDNSWTIESQISGLESLLLNNSQIAQIEQSVNIQTGQFITMDVTYIPIIPLKTSAQDQQQYIYGLISDLLPSNNNGLRITSLELAESPDQVTVELQIPEGGELDNTTTDLLRNIVDRELGSDAGLVINATTYQQINL